MKTMPPTQSIHVKGAMMAVGVLGLVWAIGMLFSIIPATLSASMNDPESGALLIQNRLKWAMMMLILSGTIFRCGPLMGAPVHLNADKWRKLTLISGMISAVGVFLMVFSLGSLKIGSGLLLGGFLSGFVVHLALRYNHQIT